MVPGRPLPARQPRSFHILTGRQVRRAWQTGDSVSVMSSLASGRHLYLAVTGGPDHRAETLRVLGGASALGDRPVVLRGEIWVSKLAPNSGGSPDGERAAPQ